MKKLYLLTGYVYWITTSKFSRRKVEKYVFYVEFLRQKRRKTPQAEQTNDYFDSRNL